MIFRLWSDADGDDNEQTKPNQQSKKRGHAVFSIFDSIMMMMI